MESFEVALPQTVNFECRQSQSNALGQWAIEIVRHTTRPGVLAVSWTPEHLEFASGENLARINLSITKGLLIDESESLLQWKICTLRVVMHYDSAGTCLSDLLLWSNTVNLQAFREVVQAIQALDLPVPVKTDFRDIH